MEDDVTEPAAPSARIVCFGEILLRLASTAPATLLQDRHLTATFCGAEANVAVALAGFGHRCTMATALPANAIGDAARQELGSLAVDLAASEVPGARMGTYFLQPGAMMRPSRIIYDRADSAFARSGPADYDWAQLLGGADWLVAGGVTAALGRGPLEALQAALSAARDLGVTIAFDTNFRPALWAGRESEAATILRDLSSRADVLFAGRRAVAMLTGQSFDHDKPDEAFHQAALAMFRANPRLKAMAATRRVVQTTDRQDLTALLADREGLSVSETVALEAIVDRVGTGDAYAAGIIHGLATGRTRDETVNFALGCSQWAHSIPGDFLRATAQDIEGLVTGSRDVSR